MLCSESREGFKPDPLRTETRMSLMASALSGYDPKLPACPITAGLEYSSVQTRKETERLGDNNNNKKKVNLNLQHE